ncbi:hypothetical protein E5P55_01320 [Candidatus Pinguicoccus supinus]|uniref:Isoleucine--tRNA ligase n=1 Tax=Candidatus Pinguicoccus supinus TaxID=2529394 RepID=A0A7T0BRS3_9BACT|nr:hypothetical protein E5P55_01320 [Candidatus Pinguicoccus supinus]
MPSNKAILFNKKFKYVFFQINHIQTIYVCSLLFFKYIILKLNFTYSFKIKLIVEGKEFKQFYYGSIFFNLGLLPMINSNYVDNFFGTGFLHVAPSHGLNDYVHSLKFNLKSQAFLTQNSFINNFYMIGGKEFLLINKCKFYFISNLLILNNLLKKNKIIIFEKYRHEYPFC